MFTVSRGKKVLDQETQNSGGLTGSPSQGGFEIVDHKTHQIKGGRGSPFGRAM